MARDADQKAKLILVGTVHGDPWGYQRAGKLLAMVRPRLITVEISRFSLRFRQQQKLVWQRQFRQALASLTPAERRHLALKRVAAQIAWPFEVQIAQDYATQTGVGWRAIDIGRLARYHLRRYRREFLTPENLQNLLLTEDGDWGQYIHQEYRQAHLALSQPDRWRGLRRQPWVPPETAGREKILARRLRALANGVGRVVHLGGWTHLLTGAGGPTLAQHLQDLQPRRFLLDQMDNPSSLGSILSCEF